jgi:hypothetical protein
MRPRFLAAALALLVGSLLAGCSLSSPPDPFAHVYGTGVGPWITRPGWQQGFLFGDATNNSHSTLTIDSVSLAGRGVGSVVTVSVMIAPLVTGIHADPGANYQTDPPVNLLARCHKQALFRVRGYREKPGGQFRLWIIVTARKPGQWNIPAQVVTYTENGTTQTHAFPIRYWGTVRAHAHVSGLLTPADSQRQCVRQEGAHYLHFYYYRN